MTQKSTPRAKLIRPDDPGHGVTFDRFSEIVSSAWLEKVERTLGFEGPNDDFRRSLVRLFWHFYRNSLPEGGVKFYRWSRLDESASRIIEHHPRCLYVL